MLSNGRTSQDRKRRGGSSGRAGAFFKTCRGERRVGQGRGAGSVEKERERWDGAGWSRALNGRIQGTGLVLETCDCEQEVKGN